MTVELLPDGGLRAEQALPREVPPPPMLVDRDGRLVRRGGDAAARRYDRALRFYVRDGRDVVWIARVVGVPAQVVGRWREAHGWDRARELHALGQMREAAASILKAQGGDDHAARHDELFMQVEDLVQGQLARLQRRSKVPAKDLVALTGALERCLRARRLIRGEVGALSASVRGMDEDSQLALRDLADAMRRSRGRPVVETQSQDGGAGRDGPDSVDGARAASAVDLEGASGPAADGPSRPPLRPIETGIGMMLPIRDADVEEQVLGEGAVGAADEDDVQLRVLRERRRR